MDRNHKQLWDEMLEEFRALGGIADNVCLDDGPLGRGLFPIDPSKPIRVLIPKVLLVDPKYVTIESDGVFHLHSDAPVGAREKAFLENYQRNFSWGVSHQDAKTLLQMIQEAPAEVREFLTSPLGATEWLAGPFPHAISERFFASRVYGRPKARPVIMPIVELANHGHTTSYDDDGLTIGLSGLFSGEILVGYNVACL